MTLSIISYSIKLMAKEKVEATTGNQVGKPGRGSRQGEQAGAAGREAGREWRCLTCGFLSSPDGKGYSQAMLHPCTGKRKLALVDKATGEVLATHIIQAQQKGLIPKKQPPEPKATAPKARAKTKDLETPLPKGESVAGYDESEHLPKTEPPPEGEPEPKEPKIEGISGEIVEGDALWIKAQVSMKTMTYYELAKSRVAREDGRNLSLGDFLDICVDDYFKGRGQELGIVYTEKKE